MSYFFKLTSKKKSVSENIEIKDNILDLSKIELNKKNIICVKELLKKTVITLHLNLKWLSAIYLSLNENKDIQELIFPEENIKNNECIEILEKILLENNTITKITPNPNKKTTNEFLKLNNLKQMFEKDSVTLDSNRLKYIDLIIDITKEISEKNILKNITYSVNTVKIEEHIKKKLLELFSYPFQHVNFSNNPEMIKLLKKESEFLIEKNNILSINLSDSNIGDQWLFIQKSLLLNQKNLNTLDIRKNKIKKIGDDFIELMKYPIKTINLSDNPIQDIINFSAFEKSEILNLYLANCQINSEKLQLLLNHLSNTSIKKLVLLDNPLIETIEIEKIEKILEMLKNKTDISVEKIEELIEKNYDKIFIFCEILKIYEDIEDKADVLIKQLFEKSQYNEKLIFTKILNSIKENIEGLYIQDKIALLIKTLLEESHKNITQTLTNFIENQKSLTEIYLGFTPYYLEVDKNEKEKKSIHLTKEFFNGIEKSNIQYISINTDGADEEIKNKMKGKLKSIPFIEKEKEDHKINISDDTNKIIKNEKLKIKNKLSQQNRRNSIFGSLLSPNKKNDVDDEKTKKLSGSF